MNFKSTDIARYLKTPDPKIRCVLIFGTNEGMINTYLKQFARTVVSDLKDAFQVSELTMDALEGDIGALYAEFNARSLMGGRRVVIVKDVNNNLTNPLKKILGESSSDTLLILTSLTLNTKSSLVTFAKDNPDFAMIACYEDRDSGLRTAAKEYIISNGMTTTAEAMELLCARLSGDRQAAVGELDKLITYMGTRRHIEFDDVKNVIGDTSDSSFEDLCYLTASGRTDKAMEAYTELLHQGEEPVGIVRSLTYHFFKLMELQIYLEKSRDIENYIKIKRVKFYRKADLMLQAGIWTKSRIADTLELLYNCERDCKTTGYPAEEILSYTILRLSGAARKFSH